MPRRTETPDLVELYRLMVENVREYAIFALDPDGHVLTWNAGARRLTGYAPDEIIGQSFSVFFSAEDRASGKPGRELERAAAQGYVEDESWRLRKDGTRFWANVIMTALRTDDGELVGFGKVTRDLSARRTNEEALRLSEQRFRLMVQSVRDYAIFMLDPDGRVATWNEGAERLNGYTADEIVGRPFSVFFSPEDLAAGRPARELEEAARTGRFEEEEGWRVRKDGSRYLADIVVSAVRDADGQLIGYAKVIRDLTERHAARERELDAARRFAVQEEQRRGAEAREAALRELNAELDARASEERALRRLAQAVTAASNVSEIMHEIAEGALAVSEAAGAYVEQVVESRTQVEIVATAGAPTPATGQRVTYPGSLTEELISRREPVFLTRMEGIGAAMAPYLDARCRGCSVLVVPLIGAEHVLGALVLLRRPDEPPFEHGIVTRVRTLGDLASIALQRLLALDESERRRVEAERAVRSRDDVLSVVSHDLRNPVATVAMSAALLRDPDVPLSPDERRKQIEIIERSAHRMNRLIGDLLDVARIESGRFALDCHCEDPRALASDACESFRILAAEKSLSLGCELAPHVPRVLADRDRILQALSNFLNNAVKFTPASGSIRIALCETDGHVRFTVTDTGPGMSTEELPHVFDRFWQAKRTAHLGSGLGLAIAKGIAEAHHGGVSAHNDAGGGSTFALWLPSSPECER